MNLCKNDGDGFFYGRAVHAVPPFAGTVTLHEGIKSSKTGAILWLLSGRGDHEVLRLNRKRSKAIAEAAKALFRRALAL
jgi:hypothetical protein